MENKIDQIEIDWKESYKYEELLHNRTKKKYFYCVMNTIIALGFIVIVLSPFIIDYFTK